MSTCTCDVYNGIKFLIYWWVACLTTGEGYLAFIFYSKSEFLLLDILSWLAVPAFWCDCAGSACGHCENGRVHACPQLCWAPPWEIHWCKMLEATLGEGKLSTVWKIGFVTYSSEWGWERCLFMAVIWHSVKAGSIGPQVGCWLHKKKKTPKTDKCSVKP